MEYGWPLLTFALIYVSYYVGRVLGFSYGLQDGLNEGSNIAMRQTLLWCRQKYDINITDYEIDEACQVLKELDR